MRHLDIFLAFYNLRLQPKKPSQRDGLELSRRDCKKLRKFLEQYAPKVFHLKDKAEFDQFVAERKEWSDIFEVWGTLGFYEYKNGVDWFHSNDLEGLLFDYQKMEGLVEDLLQTQTLHVTHLSWLNDLGKFQGRSLIALNRDGTPFDGERIDLKSHRIIESSGYLLDWHGIAISEIGTAIYESLSSLLRGEQPIKRCILPTCDRIFVPSERGRGAERIYCSVSCRVKAYKNR